MKKSSIDNLGELQREVMEKVWEMGEASVHQILEVWHKKKKPAYTTILTIMQKLEKSGWLKHKKNGRNYIYYPTKDRKNAGIHSIRSLVQKVFQGDKQVLFQYLLDDEEISESDLNEFKKMIDERRRGNKDV